MTAALFGMTFFPSFQIMYDFAIISMKVHKLDFCVIFKATISDYLLAKQQNETLKPRIIHIKHNKTGCDTMCSCGRAPGEYVSFKTAVISDSFSL